MHIEKPYLDLLNQVLEFGDVVEGRNSTTRELFGARMEFDLSSGYFPLLTTKKMAWKSIVGELIAFCRGYQYNDGFKKLDCNVWTANCQDPKWLGNPHNLDAMNHLGRIYGAQWRNWRKPDGKTVDQLGQLIEDIKNNPQSRRHIVTAWNPGELDEMCLPPCHTLWQINITSDNKMDLQMYQRSADMFLGVPFNIASYSLLLLLLCHVCGCTPGRFIHIIGSAHIYEDHIPQVKEQLSRTMLRPPKVEIDCDPRKDPMYYGPTDIKLCDYHSHEPIKANMTV